MNREFIRDKLICAIARAKARGIRISTNGWNVTTNRVTKRAEIRGNEVYILGLIIEGKMCGLGEDYNGAAARTLGIRSAEMQCFSNGFCTGSDYIVKTDDETFLFNLGCELSKQLGMG